MTPKKHIPHAIQHGFATSNPTTYGFAGWAFLEWQKTFPEVKALALALIQEEEGPNYLSTLLQPLRPDFLVDEDDIADGFAKMSEAFEAFTQELDRIRGVFENIGVRENE